MYCFQWSGYTQEYTFDQYYEYSQDDYIVFFFVNSADDSYVMFGNSTKDGIYGRIKDSKKQVFHKYTLQNVNNDVVFTYDYSTKFTNHRVSEEKKVDFKYTTIILDSTKTKLTVEKIKRRNQKKLGSFEAIYDNNNEFILSGNTYVFVDFHFFDARKKEFPKNRLPIYVRYDFGNGTIRTSNLKKRKKTNIKLSITKEQLKYN